jgi:hypothetical protein
MKAYTDKTRYLFVQLRARGISLGVISTQLDVPKSTLGDWDKSFADEIARLRAIEWEVVEEKFGRTLEQDLCAMAERIRKWEARIDRMNPDHFRVREVLAVLRETRREYFRRRAILMAPLDNTLTRAVTRSLSRHPDEAGRYTFLPSTPLHHTNDLQQPPTQPSGCGGSSVEPTSGTPDVRRIQTPETGRPETDELASNPEGIVPSSPGLRGTSYPGSQIGEFINPNGVAPVLTKSFIGRGPISPDTLDNNAGHSADPTCDSAPSDATVQQPVVPNLSCFVTPDVRRGLTSPETLESTTAQSKSFDAPGARPSPFAAPFAGSTTINEPTSTSANPNHASSIPPLLPSLEIPSESELQKEHHLSASR